MEAGIANMEKIMGYKFGDDQRHAAARRRPLRRARFHARHDGHDSESRPQRPDRASRWPTPPRTSASRGIATAASSRCMATSCMGVQKREGEDHEPFEVVIHEFKHEKYHQDIVDTELTAEDQQELVKRFKALVKERTGKDFPNDPWDQLRGAAGAVFGSWMNDRAIVYRRKYNIPSEWGTAVNVQAMVYGNTGENSGSGVAFTRNPANGANEFYGEFLINAQGEDVVAGVRTPEPVLELKKQMPEVLRGTDEGPRDPGKAFQGRAGRRVHDPGRQAVHAPDPQRQAHRRRRAQVLHGHGQGEAHRLGNRRFCATRPISSTSCSRRSSISPKSRRPRSSPPVCPPVPARLPARSISTPTAPCWPREKGEKVLLVRNETSPEDLRGMIAAEGILTAKGGVSSHAALVARQMGKVCVCGASRAADRLRQAKTVDGCRPDLQGRRLPLHRRHQRHRLCRPAQDRAVAKSSPACCTATKPRRRPRSSRTSSS